MSFKISKLRKKRTRATSPSTTGNGKNNRIPLSIFLTGTSIWAFVLLFLYGGRTLHYADLVPGQRAPETLAASIDFQCIDYAATELKRNQASEKVPPIFSINLEGLNDVEHNINKLLDMLISKPEDLENTLEVMEIDLSPSDITKLFPSNQIEDARTVLLEKLAETWSLGIIATDDRPVLLEPFKKFKNIHLFSHKTETYRETAIVNIFNINSAAQRISAKVFSELSKNRKHEGSLSKLLTFWLITNLIYEPGLSETARKEAEKQVDPVFLRMHSGDTLMEAGQLINDQILAKLSAHHEALINAQSRSETIRMLLVQAGLLLASLFIFGGILFLLQPNLLHQHRPVIVMGILCIITLLSIKGLIYLSSLHLLPFSMVPLLAPIAIAPLIASILYGGAFALAGGIWTSLAVAITMDDSFMILIQGLIVTVTAVLSARDVHKRSSVFKAGLWIGLAQALFAVSITVLNQQSFDVIALYTAITFMGGLFVAFVTLLLIPPFEFIFKLTSDIRLLELSDLGHPLLQRLALEAPGTYHHSLMVANLAQAAAQEINANDLLVRVCAYFHDIGKLSKPEFFIENTNLAKNPHDEVTPSMSALILVSHVKEGVSLAARYKLPPPIVEGIQQHHGTGLISFFFNRAQEQNLNDPPSEGDYRYPGPKPATPEMGILLLADSVEAASRSMEKASSSNIETLVNTIFKDRLLDKQLDSCGLTLAQLATIRENFIFNLNNMLHGRIAYPKNEDRNKQPAETPQNKHPQNTTIGSVANETGSAA